MIRRRQPRTANVNRDRWLVSYADFITLLFGFFVVMYSVSQVNEQAYRELAQGLGATFTGVDSVAELAQNSAADEVVTPTALAQQVQALVDELVAQGQLAQDQVTVSATDDWAEISVNANLLFASGQAVPSAEAGRVFEQLSALLAPYANAVEVSGHTDSQPIRNAQFSNNWELSAARATAVVKLLAEGGVAPERLAATGYGEFRPVADNSSEVGRERNRRVVLMVARHRSERPQVPMEAVPALLGEQGGADSESVPDDPNRAPGAVTQDFPIEKKAPVVEPVVREDGSLLFTNDPEKRREPPSKN